MRRKSLAEGLGLNEGYAIFKDYVTHLEYIRQCRELTEKGLYVELGAYQCQVFMDWRFVGGDKWKAVNDLLNGAGVESMQAKWAELFSIVEETKDEIEVPAKNMRWSFAAPKWMNLLTKAKKEGSKPALSRAQGKKEMVIAKPAKTKAQVKKAVVMKKEEVKSKKKEVANKKVVIKKPVVKKPVVKKAAKKNVDPKKVVAKKPVAKKPK